MDIYRPVLWCESTLEINVGDIRPVSCAFKESGLIVTLADDCKMAAPDRPARLSDGAGHDAAGRGAAVCVFQMEEVVVRGRKVDFRSSTLNFSDSQG